jgi:hypothetical protein
MIQYTFYHAPRNIRGASVTRVLTLDKPIGDDIVHTIKHDVRASLTGSLPPEDRTVTPAERLKEKAAITTAQRSHNHFRKTYPQAFTEMRDEFLRAILGAQTPRWGGVRITLT